MWHSSPIFIADAQVNPSLLVMSAAKPAKAKKQNSKPATKRNGFGAGR
jgi:hypothetical protein